eukprot:jgi/Ulvmu1/9622/UM054_0052.1
MEKPAAGLVQGLRERAAGFFSCGVSGRPHWWAFSESGRDVLSTGQRQAACDSVGGCCGLNPVEGMRRRPRSTQSTRGLQAWCAQMRPTCLVDLYAASRCLD